MQYLGQKHLDLKHFYYYIIHIFFFFFFFQEDKRQEDLRTRARKLIAEARQGINKPQIEGIEEMANAAKAQAQNPATSG